MKIQHLVFFYVVIMFTDSASADTPTGRINILWDKPQQIQLVPDLKLYPGQTIDVVSAGQVDVDHEFGERRRCKWFGAKCWYEQWDRPTWLGVDSLEIELQLEEGTVTGTSPSYKLEVPLSADYANFGRGVRLSGMLWKNGRVAPKQRGPCIGRPKFCSQGDLVLSFANVNVSPRLDALEKILALQKIGNLDVAAVTAREFIDPLLFDPTITSDSAVYRLSRILTLATERMRDQIPDKNSSSAAPLHMKVIDLASFSVKLARITPQDSAKLRTLITESYLDRGDFASATKEAPKMMAEASTAFDNSPNADNALIYARALKANAAAWREKGSRNSSSDIRVSIALLDKATDLLWAYTAHTGVSKVMADINVDTARMLNLLRTGAELKAAEARVVAAICFQMHSEDGSGTSFEVWRTKADDPVVENCKSVEKARAAGG